MGAHLLAIAALAGCGAASITAGHDIGSLVRYQEVQLRTEALRDGQETQRTGSHPRRAVCRGVGARSRLLLPCRLRCEIRRWPGELFRRSQARDGFDKTIWLRRLPF